MLGAIYLHAVQMEKHYCIMLPHATDASKPSNTSPEVYHSHPTRHLLQENLTDDSVPNRRQGPGPMYMHAMNGSTPLHLAVDTDTGSLALKF